MHAQNTAPRPGLSYDIFLDWIVEAMLFGRHLSHRSPNSALTEQRNFAFKLQHAFIDAYIDIRTFIGLLRHLRGYPCNPFLGDEDGLLGGEGSVHHRLDDLRLEYLVLWTGSRFQD